MKMFDRRDLTWRKDNKKRCPCNLDEVRFLFKMLDKEAKGQGMLKIIKVEMKLQTILTKLSMFEEQVTQLQEDRRGIGRKLHGAQC